MRKRPQLIPVVDDSILRGTETVRRVQAQIKDLYPHRVDGLCRCGCGRNVVAPSREWHGAECRENAYFSFSIAVGDGSALRSFVHSRERGVCQHCGKDCNLEHYVRLRMWKAGTLAHKPTRPLWDVAHVVAVKDGGARLGPDNVLCLCTRCHKLYDQIPR